MSRYRFWEDGDRYPSKKAPAPEHGIKVKKAGNSWWGKRWLDALEAVLGADSGRLARGRSYARAGRTHDLEVKRGEVVMVKKNKSTAPVDPHAQQQPTSELKLVVTQVRSGIGGQENQRLTLRALGLRKIRQSAEWHDTPQARIDDAARQALLEVHGERVIRVTWTQATAQTAQTQQRIELAGAPRPRARP